MNVLFRVDASLQVGTGHVMRCLTLAEELRAEGAICRFVCRAHAGNLGSYIRQRGFETILLSAAPQNPYAPDFEPYGAWLGATWQQDVVQTLSVLTQIGKQDWLVVDHYALNEQWEREVAGGAERLLVIDDLANRRHHADILLDQTIGRSAADYRALTNVECELRCGVEHVLLRQDYVSWRRTSLERREGRALKRILISLGGVDKDNRSREVLAELRESPISANLQICLVLGEGSPWVVEMRDLVQSMMPGVELKVGVSNMPELLASCDLAVGAAGTSAWERCYLGVPTLMLVLADNQRQIAERLSAAGAVRILDAGSNLREQLVTEIKALAESPELLHAMSHSAAQLVASSGTKSLAQDMARKAV